MIKNKQFYFNVIKKFTLIKTPLRVNFVKVNRGFTLIELLVVIAVIGALAGVVLFGTSGVFETSRDTQRKSDLDQYRVALETYANNNSGLFPTGSGVLSTTICTTLGLTGGCPEDPTWVSQDLGVDPPTWTAYTYDSNASGTDYVIYAELEKTSGDYWIICSNGKSGQQSGSPGSNIGVCPLP